MALFVERLSLSSESTCWTGVDYSSLLNYSRLWIRSWPSYNSASLRSFVDLFLFAPNTALPRNEDSQTDAPDKISLHLVSSTIQPVWICASFHCWITTRDTWREIIKRLPSVWMIPNDPCRNLFLKFYTINQDKHQWTRDDLHSYIFKELRTLCSGSELKWRS